jgi:ABC-2 type transport system ATP-binding protein
MGALLRIRRRDEAVSVAGTSNRRAEGRAEPLGPTEDDSGLLTVHTVNTGPDAPMAISLDGVTCRVGGTAILHDVSLGFESGAVTGVLGPNGAGKSTLLGLIMGLRHMHSGSAQVLGVRLPARSRELRRRIGVVLQETALYEELTATENLRFAAALYGVRPADRRIYEVLDLLGLAERARDVVGTLSGGMRRRIAIARALLHDPELLIIDEPTLGVDVDTRHAIWSHIRVLRTRGTTVLVATNYLDEAEALCDKVAVLRDGRLVAYETPASLVARAGRCVDIDCQPHEVTLIGTAVRELDGVLRIDNTPSGAAVFLEGGVAADAVVRSVLRTAPSVGGVRVRAADLAEVFRALAVTA